MVDLTNGDSYFDADNWLKDVDRYAGRRTRRVMLVGTKCDVAAKRVVDTEALADVRPPRPCSVTQPLMIPPVVAQAPPPLL